MKTSENIKEKYMSIYAIPWNVIYAIPENNKVAWKMRAAASYIKSEITVGGESI